jgi:hypothetical protein
MGNANIKYASPIYSYLPTSLASPTRRAFFAAPAVGQLVPALVLIPNPALVPKPSHSVRSKQLWLCDFSTPRLIQVCIVHFPS